MLIQLKTSYLSWCHTNKITDFSVLDKAYFPQHSHNFTQENDIQHYPPYNIKLFAI
jgi:hypothetical protein